MKRHVRIWAVAIILLTGTVCGYGQNTTYIYDHVKYGYGNAYDLNSYTISSIDLLSISSVNILNEIPYTKNEYRPVKFIFPQAFSGCYNLKTIQLPSNITHIGERSFINCYNLKSITLSDSLKKIFHHAFVGCI